MLTLWRVLLLSILLDWLQLSNGDMFLWLGGRDWGDLAGQNLCSLQMRCSCLRRHLEGWQISILVFFALRP